MTVFQDHRERSRLVVTRNACREPFALFGGESPRLQSAPGKVHDFGVSEFDRHRIRARRASVIAQRTARSAAARSPRASERRADAVQAMIASMC